MKIIDWSHGQSIIIYESYTFAKCVYVNTLKGKIDVSNIAGAFTFAAFVRRDRFVILRQNKEKMQIIVQILVYLDFFL